MRINKRKIFISISTMALLVFIFSTVMITKANNVLVFENTKNCQSVISNNNLMLSSFKENCINLQGITDNSLNYTFTLNNTPDYVQYSNTGFCAVEIIEKSKEKSTCNINIGNINDDYLKFKSLIFPYEFNKTDFAIDNDLNIYTANCTVGNDISVFSKHGDFTAKITAEETINQLLYFNGSVFVFCIDNVYTIENNTLKPVNISDKITTPVTVTGSNSLSDKSGKLFLSDDYSLTLIADFNSNCLCFNTNRYILAVTENEIYGNDINNPNITVSYSLSITPSFVYYAEPYIYAGGYSGDNYVIEKLQENQLNITEIQDTTTVTTPTTEPTKTTDATEPTEFTEATKATEPTETTTAQSTLTYSSDAYKINQQNCIISNVISQTTVADFKKNFSCNGNIIVLDKNNNTKSSGYVGTGMTVVFSNDNEKIQFTISVNGDLTGEGNVNTLDINKMFDFLLKKDTPTTAQLLAGDFDSNGILTNKDLLLLERLRKSF